MPFLCKNVFSYTGNSLISNFICIVVATVFCSIGLISNSSLLLLGSMFIAPFFDPMLLHSLALVSGNVKGMISSFIQLVVMSLISVGLGLAIGMGNHIWQSYPEKPTDEMISRLDDRHNLIAFVIALLSGCLLAVSGKYHQLMIIAGISVSINVIPALSNAGIYLSYVIDGKSANKKDSLNNVLSNLLTALINVAGLLVGCILTTIVLCRLK